MFLASVVYIDADQVVWHNLQYMHHGLVRDGLTLGWRDFRKSATKIWLSVGLPDAEYRLASQCDSLSSLVNVCSFRAMLVYLWVQISGTSRSENFAAACMARLLAICYRLGSSLASAQDLVFSCGDVTHCLTLVDHSALRYSGWCTVVGYLQRNCSTMWALLLQRRAIVNDMCAAEHPLSEIITFACLYGRPQHHQKKARHEQTKAILDAFRDAVISMLARYMTLYLTSVFLPQRRVVRPAPALVSPKKSGSYVRVHPHSSWHIMENALASAQSLSCILKVRKDDVHAGSHPSSAMTTLNKKTSHVQGAEKTCVRRGSALGDCGRSSDAQQKGRASCTLLQLGDWHRCTRRFAIPARDETDSPIGGGHARAHR